MNRKQFLKSFSGLAAIPFLGSLIPGKQIVKAESIEPPIVEPNIEVAGSKPVELVYFNPEKNTINFVYENKTELSIDLVPPSERNSIKLLKEL